MKLCISILCANGAQEDGAQPSAASVAVSGRSRARTVSPRLVANPKGIANLQCTADTGPIVTPMPAFLLPPYKQMHSVQQQALIARDFKAAFFFVWIHEEGPLAGLAYQSIAPMMYPFQAAAGRAVKLQFFSAKEYFKELKAGLQSLAYLAQRIISFEDDNPNIRRQRPSQRGDKDSKKFVCGKEEGNFAYRQWRSASMPARSMSSMSALWNKHHFAFSP